MFVTNVASHTEKSGPTRGKPGSDMEIMFSKGLEDRTEDIVFHCVMRAEGSASKEAMPVTLLESACSHEPVPDNGEDRGDNRRGDQLVHAGEIEQEIGARVALAATIALLALQMRAPPSEVPAHGGQRVVGDMRKADLKSRFLESLVNIVLPSKQLTLREGRDNAVLNIAEFKTPAPKRRNGILVVMENTAKVPVIPSVTPAVVVGISKR